MGTGFSKKKKQAKQLQQQFQQMQSQLKDTEVTGVAANGLVTIILNGENEMKSIKINPECVDKEDIEGLELLIKTAYQDGMAKLQANTASAMPQGMPDLSQFGF